MKYVYRDGAVVEKTAEPPRVHAVNVITDTIDPLRHMGTGIVSDSKSHHRKMTKAIGCIEVGTDPAASRPMPKYEPSMHEIVNDVRRAISESRR